jgi:hypothetical protein
VSGAWSMISAFSCFPMGLMFGSNENLIFVLTGDSDTVLNLFDDHSGLPVYLWGIYMHSSSTKRIHVVSNLK